MFANKYSITLGFILCAKVLFSQDYDSSKISNLNNFQKTLLLIKTDVERLPEVQGTVVYAGKKNEVIKISTLNADLSTNNPRQVFGKVPGVTIWENDGSGIQMGISTRGLSPNRSWEFNVRQNGYDITSEVFGYPESYFSPPMEAVSTIEVVRGAASLQFGPQFGGLLNYVIKKGDANKPFVFETQQTLGSYGLFNSYNALGGTFKKFSYYGYFHHRHADGWRENSRYNINTGYASVNYAANKKLNIGLQVTRMDYQSQQAGGLTDSLMDINARQSFRSRNWFSTPWNLAALTFDFQLSENAKLSVKVFATLAQRNSVGFTKGINIADTYNLAIKSYNPRQVDRDAYKNLGTEVRFLKTYALLKQKSILAAGLRLYSGSTIRQQQGTGTAGNNFDLSIDAWSNGKAWGRELQFVTNNGAFFVENIFKIGKRLSLTPGARLELLNSKSQGYINTTATGNLEPKQQGRVFLLFGFGSEVQITSNTNVYANISQSYRPVTYSELTPATSTELIDQNLKDASGYNADLGYRGKYKNFLSFDLGAFYLKYDNRIGTVSQNNLPFRTNVGTSVSRGLESFIELDAIKLLSKSTRLGSLRLFVSYALVDARYTKWNNPAIANDPSKSIEDKKVEYAPSNISRYGLSYAIKSFSASLQYNQVSSVFTDAANTEKSNSTATIGKIAAYAVADFSLKYVFADQYNLKAGINNLADKMYATRRAGGYPGPGLLPANGRTFYIGFGAKF